MTAAVDHAAAMVWLDGEIRRSDEARLTLWNHSLHYGFGVFEGLRAFDVLGEPNIFRLDEHVDRMFQSANLIGLPLAIGREDLVAAHHEVLAANDLTSAYLRPIAFVGDWLAGLNSDAVPMHVAVLAWPWELSMDVESRGVHLSLSHVRKPDPRWFPCQAKASGGYLQSKIAHARARQAGFDDALLLDSEGHLSEATSSNVFLVRDGSLSTPTTDSCLAGITRASIMELARECGIRVAECAIQPHELGQADEVFLTSTASSVLPVWQVDGRDVGNGQTGPITQLLAEEYRQMVMS